MITEDSLAACFMTLAALGYRLLMLNRTVYNYCSGLRTAVRRVYPRCI